MTRVKLKDIRPNPFRRVDRYPIRQEKIDALLESIDATGFWDNIVARVTDEPGVVEIAYGHHRIEALNQKYKPTHEIGVILRDLDDETMLAMMVRENMEEWGSNVAVLFETVEAVIEAFAEGKIELPPVPFMTRPDAIREAPSFIPGMTHMVDTSELSVREARDAREKDRVGRRIYTTESLARYLGWTIKHDEPADKAYAILNALTLIEQGYATKDDFDNLSVRQADLKVVEIRRKVRPLMVAKVHRDLAEQYETEAAQVDDEKERVQLQGKADVEYRKAELVENPPPKPPLDINDYAPKLLAEISHVLEDDRYANGLNQLLEHREYLEPAIVEDIVRTLELVEKRAADYGDQFQRPIGTERRLELVQQR